MPWHPTACFRGWPDHPTTMEQRLFMILAFAYYLYELIGTAVGVGTRLKTVSGQGRQGGLRAQAVPRVSTSAHVAVC